MEEKQAITLTPRAVEEIKRQLAKGSGDMKLRVSVIGGGCSGYQYQMNPITEENAVTDYDDLFDFDGLTVVVDSVSLQYMNGTTIDFESELDRTGFLFQNPNSRHCGCGRSFS